MFTQNPEPLMRFGLPSRAEMNCNRYTVTGLKLPSPLNRGKQRNVSIPPEIINDPLLERGDVYAWIVIKTLTEPNDSTKFTVTPLLKERVDYSKATFSKVICVLRLTRWISACEQPADDEASNKAKRYAIHDTPYTIDEIISLDSQYLAFVQKQLTHANARVRHIAEVIWKNSRMPILQKDDENIVPQDRWASGNGFTSLPTQYVRQIQYSGRGGNLQGQKLSPQENLLGQKMTLVNQDIGITHKKMILGQGQKVSPQENLLGQKVTLESQDIEITHKKMILGQGQKVSQGGTCSSSFLINNINTTTTTTTTTENAINLTKIEQGNGLEMPLIFPHEFKPGEVKLAEIYLSRIEPELQQSFLDETAGKIDTKRKTSNPVRNPIGYLSWLCNAHTNGFTALTSLSVRYAEKRTLALKNCIDRQSVKPKERVDPDRQDADKKSRTLSAEAYKSKMSDFKSSLNLGRQSWGGTLCAA